jgi:carbon-monoxide dehydrogenase medium subunit
VRNRGTVGGSLAHADLAAELPGIAVTCEAEIVAAGVSGTRTVAAADFFLGALSTSLAPGELVVELRLPAWPAQRRWAFLEFAKQRGAFALAGVALYYDVEGGLAKDAHIGVIGASSRLQRLSGAEALLNGRPVDAQNVNAAARAAAAAVDPSDDLDASAAYRRSLVGTLVERALVTASSREATKG